MEARANGVKTNLARILCALSGGVDSSVAAWLLQQQGHEVLGVFLRNGIEGSDEAAHKSCCSASDARDAARVADKLGIAFWALDYEKEFASIIERFHADYRSGRTPSPCVLCNQDVKFGELFSVADGLGVDAVATGHYARLEGGTIARAKDRAKDQSYFLFGIDRERVARLCFPLGELSKAEVRAHARAAGLSTADKKESMELCFVPSGDYRDVLRAEAPLRAGRFVARDGRDLGPHDGFEAYTVGQRRGLPALGKPHYVVALDTESGNVVLGERDDLQQREARLENVRWLIETPAPFAELRCDVQIRARHTAAAATLVPDDAGDARVLFDVAQDSLAPGQAAVFYDGDRVLGGAWIGAGVEV